MNSDLYWKIDTPDADEFVARPMLELRGEHGALGAAVKGRPLGFIVPVGDAGWMVRSVCTGESFSVASLDGAMQALVGRARQALVPLKRARAAADAGYAAYREAEAIMAAAMQQEYDRMKAERGES